MKNTKTCWQMLMAQNSARNMPMAEAWHRLGVMFHKLKQTNYTSLLANAWTVVQHLRLGNNLGVGASPVALSIWAWQDIWTVVQHLRLGNNLGVGASPVALSIWARQDISRIQVLGTYFFPTPPIKLKLGLQMGGRLLVVTHWINQKQGEISKYDLNVVLKLGLQIGGRLRVVTHWINQKQGEIK
jgi:hypothetical protein